MLVHLQIDGRAKEQACMSLSCMPHLYPLKPPSADAASILTI